MEQDKAYEDSLEADKEKVDILKINEGVVPYYFSLI